MPLLLPKYLPSGYRWLGPSYFSPGASGLIESRSSTFVHDPIAGSPSVELCVRGPGVDLCPHGMQAIRRSIEFGEVVVAFDLQAPSEAELEWWRSVELVSDLSVAWLD